MKSTEFEDVEKNSQILCISSDQSTFLSGNSYSIQSKSRIKDPKVYFIYYWCFPYCSIAIHHLLRCCDIPYTFLYLIRFFADPLRKVILRKSIISVIHCHFSTSGTHVIAGHSAIHIFFLPHSHVIRNSELPRHLSALQFSSIAVSV